MYKPPAHLPTNPYAVAAPHKLLRNEHPSSVRSTRRWPVRRRAQLHPPAPPAPAPRRVPVIPPHAGTAPPLATRAPPQPAQPWAPPQPMQRSALPQLTQRRAPPPSQPWPPVEGAACHSHSTPTTRTQPRRLPPATSQKTHRKPHPSPPQPGSPLRRDHPPPLQTGPGHRLPPARPRDRGAPRRRRPRRAAAGACPPPPWRRPPLGCPRRRK